MIIISVYYTKWNILFLIHNYFLLLSSGLPIGESAIEENIDDLIFDTTRDNINEIVHVEKNKSVKKYIHTYAKERNN